MRLPLCNSGDALQGCGVNTVALPSKDASSYVRKSLTQCVLSVVVQCTVNCEDNLRGGIVGSVDARHLWRIISSSFPFKAANKRTSGQQQTTFVFDLPYFFGINCCSRSCDCISSLYCFNRLQMCLLLRNSCAHVLLPVKQNFIQNIIGSFFAASSVNPNFAMFFVMTLIETFTVPSDRTRATKNNDIIGQTRPRMYLVFLLLCIQILYH